MSDTTSDWLSRIGDAFNSPLVNGLMGMTQGFAQAAMPSRMPIPFGAALGMAAGGLQSGMRNAYATKLAQEQAQATRMQNELTASSLPFALARNKALAGIWSSPETMSRLMTPSPSPFGASASVPSLSPTSASLPAGGNDITKNALLSVPENLRAPAINAAMKAGLPMEAWPSWIAGVQTESSWNPNVPTGSKGEIGLGQVMPATGQGMGFTPQQLADPGTNLLASAMYYRQKWQQGNGDPTAAWTGYNTGNVAGNAPDYVNKSLTHLTQWGYNPNPSVPSPNAVTPQNALAIAQWYEQEANRIEAAKSMGVPALGDPATMRSAAQQYRDLALAGPKAGSIKAAELPYVGPEAAAKTSAEFANKPIVDRFGNIYIGDGQGGIKYLGRGSEVRQVWNPQTNRMEWGEVGGLGAGAVGGGTSPQGAPPSAPTGTSPPGPSATGGQAAAPPPLQMHFMEERGKDLAEQFQKIDADAASAKEGNYLFDNLRNDSQTWQMGKFADWEGDARAWLSAAAHHFGIPAEGLDRPLADYQAFLKSSGSLLRTAVHDTSSRAAVQEYNLIGQTLPQPTTSQQGFSQVADQWQGANDFRLAKQKFAAQYQNKPQDFNVEFNSQVSPTSFMLNRMAQTPQGQADMKAMLSRMQQTAEGRMAARHMLTQYRFAKEHGLFENLTPTGTAAEAVPPQGGG